MHYERMRQHGTLDGKPRRPQGDPGERWCSEHKGFAPLGEFWRCAATADGIDYVCSACRVALKREWQWLTVYGITPRAYHEMLAAQDGRCGICRAPEPGGSARFFHVDHCHRTDKVRGLLCSRCNRAMGMFGDDPGLIRRVLDWLEGDPLDVERSVLEEAS